VGVNDGILFDLMVEIEDPVDRPPNGWTGGIPFFTCARLRDAWAPKRPSSGTLENPLASNID